MTVPELRIVPYTEKQNLLAQENNSQPELEKDLPSSQPPDEIIKRLRRTAEVVADSGVCNMLTLVDRTQSIALYPNEMLSLATNGLNESGDPVPVAEGGVKAVYNMFVPTGETESFAAATPEQLNYETLREDIRNNAVKELPLVMVLNGPDSPLDVRLQSLSSSPQIAKLPTSRIAKTLGEALELSNELLQSIADKPEIIISKATYSPNSEKNRGQTLIGPGTPDEALLAIMAYDSNSGQSTTVELEGDPDGMNDITSGKLKIGSLAILDGSGKLEFLNPGNITGGENETGAYPCVLYRTRQPVLPQTPNSLLIEGAQEEIAEAVRTTNDSNRKADNMSPENGTQETPKVTLSSGDGDFLARVLDGHKGTPQMHIGPSRVSSRITAKPGTRKTWTEKIKERLSED